MSDPVKPVLAKNSTSQQNPNHPSWRKPVGMFMILGLIAVWAIVILAISPVIGALWWPLQAVFYAIAGTVWIMPLRPLLRWMELGSFR